MSVTVKLVIKGFLECEEDYRKTKITLEHRNGNVYISQVSKDGASYFDNEDFGSVRIQLTDKSKINSLKHDSDIFNLYKDGPWMYAVDDGCLAIIIDTLILKMFTDPGSGTIIVNTNKGTIRGNHEIFGLPSTGSELAYTNFRKIFDDMLV